MNWDSKILSQSLNLVPELVLSAGQGLAFSALSTVLRQGLLSSLVIFWGGCGGIHSPDASGAWSRAGIQTWAACLQNPYFYHQARLAQYSKNVTLLLNIRNFETQRG